MTGHTEVVFVHGFLSSPATWSQFIELFTQDEDLADFRWHTFAYASPPWSLHPLRRIPNLNDVADSLRTFLAHDAGARAPVILVSHSQGGLVVQRMLARMLAEGRGRELTRIRKIVMFACPNSGSELALALRRRAWFWRHPQERELRPLNEAVAETRRVVINQVVYATTSGTDRCPLPVVAFAGAQDGIVTPTSAKGVFPDVGVLPGDHFSIIQPDSPAHRSYTALKGSLLATRGNAEPAEPAEPQRAPAPEPRRPPGEPSGGTPEESRAAGATGPAAVSAPATLSAAQYGTVVDQLCDIRRVTEPSFREQLYELLPATVVHQLRRDSAARVELFALVRSFAHYPHLAPWESLVAALAVLAPDEPATARLSATLAELGLIARRASPDP